MKICKLLMAALVLITVLSFSCKTEVVNEASNPVETWKNALTKLNGVKYFYAKKEITAPGGEDSNGLKYPAGKQTSDIYYSAPNLQWITNIVSIGNPVLSEIKVETIWIGLGQV